MQLPTLCDRAIMFTLLADSQ